MSNPDLQSVINGTLNRIYGDAKPPEIVTQLLTDLRVSYVIQDEYTTIAVLSTSNDAFVSAGASKRNPVDRQNNLRGRALALSRAVRNCVQGCIVNGNG